MNRAYCPGLKIVDGRFAISDQEQLHHLRDVLRVSEGDELVIFDGAGQQYRVSVSAVSAVSVGVRVIEQLKPSGRAVRELAVACAIPKQTKMDDVIDKLTQLGVQRIIPMITERVIVRLDDKKAAQRQARWEKIALSAVKQSQRNALPVVEKVMDFSQVLVEAQRYPLKLIPALIGERVLLKDACAGAAAGPALVLIGPEGDFSPEELDAALKKGFLPVSLGETVLRVDTAAIAAAAYIMFSS